jgi:hypothetical protein
VIDVERIVAVEEGRVAPLHELEQRRVALVERAARDQLEPVDLPGRLLHRAALGLLGLQVAALEQRLALGVALLVLLLLDRSSR